MQKDFELSATLHVGVGRANNANNVGNVNNVYGVAASPISSCLKVFADNTQNGRKQQNDVGEQQPRCHQTESVKIFINWSQVIDRANISRAANRVIGYVCPEEHYSELSPRHKDWCDNRERCETELIDRLNRGYVFSPYAKKIVHEPKERIIHYHSDWVDNIAEQAVLGVIEPLYMAHFSPCAFGSIKGRGTTKMLHHLESHVKANSTLYYLQTDIRKYYEHINKQTLKRKVAEVVRDERIVAFIYTLIDSYELSGIPIGSPFSQYNANLYLTEIDNWLFEDERVITFARNMDDTCVLTRDKYDAQAIRREMEQRDRELSLEIKTNWRVAPVTYGIDILGYVIRPTHTRLRKHTKENMKRRVKQLNAGNVSDETFRQQMASHYGWCTHGDCRHLLVKTFGERLKIYNKKVKRLSEVRPRKYFGMEKERFISITDLVDKDLAVLEVADISVGGIDKVALRIALLPSGVDVATWDPTEDEQNYTITRSEVVRDRLSRDRELIPMVITMRRRGKYFCYD